MSVCLNMIVRNESHVIKRCLESHKDVIDRAVIVDTGSTDGTQQVIRETMAALAIPCEIHDRPWVDFGTNRTEALQLAKHTADYILVNDADHIWHGVLPKILTADCYSIEYQYDTMRYGVVCLLADRLNWRYVGVLHEYVESVPVDPKMKAQMLPSAYIEVKHEGARSRDPETYKRDVAILEEGLRNEPTNQRYVFYLAQSYRDSRQYEKAIEMYQRRIGMPGWDEEEWYARYQVARLSESIKAPPAMVSYAYLQAYQSRPTRAEPLCHLARYHRFRSEYSLAYLYASQAALMKAPKDTLFVEEPVYSWMALDELAVSAWHAGQFDVGEHAAKAALKRPHPLSETPRLEQNLAFYTQKSVDSKAA